MTSLYTKIIKIGWIVEDIASQINVVFETRCWQRWKSGFWVLGHFSRNALYNYHGLHKIMLTVQLWFCHLLFYLSLFIHIWSFAYFGHT